MLKRRTGDEDELSIAIIGAGFAGLGMAIQLKQRGMDAFTVFEGGSDVGGTWRDNTYPGCACDVPSHLYSFSFERNPDWSCNYSPQEEILAYLRHCAEKYRVRPHIRFDTWIAKASWVEEEKRWRLESGSGDVFFARVLVAGTGPLRTPSLPDVPGLEEFEGAGLDGVVLVAPLLGVPPREAAVADEIRAAGGLHAWTGARDLSPPLHHFREPRVIWDWLRAETLDPARRGRVVLAYGADDPRADRYALLARALPDDAVVRVRGRHDWPTWRSLWRRVLATPPWAPT